MKTLALAALVLAASALAADKSEAPSGADAMMKMMQEYGTPGPEHAKLKAIEGSWTAVTTVWMKPGDAPQSSKGESTFSWVLGDRHLKHEVAADWGGQKFEGLGFLGYDRVRKEYYSAWMDSMGTGLMTSAGKLVNGVIKDEGDFSCPMTGEKHRWFRAEWTLPADEKAKTMKHVMWQKDQKGKEYKSMEIAYSRR